MAAFLASAEFLFVQHEVKNGDDDGAERDDDFEGFHLVKND